jgi:hypothetical protein
MSTSQAFKSAFWAGMASPALLYAAPSPYISFVQNNTISSLFSAVGMYMLEAFEQVTEEGSDLETARLGFQESLKFE